MNFISRIASVASGTEHIWRLTQEVAIVAARLPPGHRLALDGSLTDPAWQRAAPHRDFVERFPETVGVARSVGDRPVEGQIALDENLRAALVRESARERERRRRRAEEMPPSTSFVMPASSRFWVEPPRD